MSSPYTSLSYDALWRLWHVETPSVTNYVSDAGGGDYGDSALISLSGYVTMLAVVVISVIEVILVALWAWPPFQNFNEKQYFWYAIAPYLFTIVPVVSAVLAYCFRKRKDRTIIAMSFLFILSLNLLIFLAYLALSGGGA